MDFAWLFGEFPPGIALMSAVQLYLLYAIWNQLKDLVKQDSEGLTKIFDRFEESDRHHTQDHSRLDNGLTYLKAKMNGDK